MKIIQPVLMALILLGACRSGSPGGSTEKQEGQDPDQLAKVLEKSLFQDLLDHWYPRSIDSLNGGYCSAFGRDWSPVESPQGKALVQQARHVWTTSFIAEHFPEHEEYLSYAAHGFRFLKESLWDPDRGGFYAYCRDDGRPLTGALQGKRVYGQAFAVYALSQYYLVSGDSEALDLAKEAFHWMEANAHDPVYGGYFEVLGDDPVPGRGLKDYNSSIHLMEALTSLCRVWPDALVRSRLEEMFLLVRDTFVHPGGYLQLYFYPDWTLVKEEDMESRSGEDRWYTQHITYGHDVETAYLLLESAGVLGLEGDRVTLAIAKRLVDHSLESGWDRENGGFFDAGRLTEDGIEIIDPHKAWWAQVEGMNALLLMYTLYPEDPRDYYGLFLKSWDHIATCLIDREYGGWYNAALDTYPGNVDQNKSHIWKTTYHNARGLVHCIQLLGALHEPHVPPAAQAAGHP